MKQRHPIAAIAVLLAAACSGGPAFPSSIDFNSQRLTRDTTWVRGRLAGAVYVPGGETLPSASLQVGAILSDEHLTGEVLHSWVRDQVRASRAYHFHEADGAGQACRIARAQDRSYISLVVCKTGVARSVCVEADQAIDQGAITSCGSTSSCFADLCDTNWLARREALDLFAATMLTIR